MIKCFCYMAAAAWLVVALSVGAAEVPNVAGTGLVVWLHTGDGEAALNLARKGEGLVHILASPGDDAAALQAKVRQARLEGVASVQASASVKALPFSNRSVNAVVADLGALKAAGPAKQEIMRVLATTGAAWVKAGGAWEVWRPEADKSSDVWSHKWYDATGNAVSKDEGIASPNSLRWIAGPQSDVGSRPQQGFRVNDGIAVVEWEFGSDGPRRRRQFLVGRDAFSGTVRWTRDSGPLGPDCLRMDPYKLVVLDGGVIYTAMREGGKIVAIDARTGKDLRTYEHSMPVSARVRWFIAVHAGRLIQTVGSELRVIDAATGELKWSWVNPDAPQAKDAEAVGKAANPAKPEPWHDMRWQPATVGWPVVGGEQGLVYLTVQTEKVKPYHLAIPDRHPPFWTGRIVALDLATGKERWRHEMNGEAINQLAVHGQHLAYLEVGTLSGPTDRKPISFGVLNSQTGELRWRVVMPPGKTNITAGAGMMMAMFSDRLWIATKSLSSYDLMTGKERSNVAIPGNPACAPPRLTTKTMAHAQGGYADIETMTMRQPRITRGSCGTEPSFAYGLQFFMPNRCTCSTFLRGHIALATEAAPSPIADGERLEKPAVATEMAAGAAEQPTDAWPTFLAGPQRWSSVKTTLPQKLAVAWTVQPAKPPAADSPLRQDWMLNNLYNGPVVGPVTDGSRLVVALAQEHAVQARSAKTGEAQWTFYAGGRIDTPPTMHGNRVYFGCRDGHVYALDAASGKLAWRFMAARAAHRMVAYGQVESKWPVHGSVLVHGGLLFAAAGYHPQVDGGMVLWALDTTTGEPKWKHIVAHEPQAVKAEARNDRERWPFPPTDNTTFKNQYSVHNLVRNEVLQSSDALVMLPGYAVKADTGEFAAKFVALEIASGFGRPPAQVRSYLWGATASLFMNHRLSDYGGPGDGAKVYLAVRTPDTGDSQVLGSSVAVDGPSVFVSRDDGGSKPPVIARYDGKAGGPPAEVWAHKVSGWRSTAIAATTDRVLVLLEKNDVLEKRTGVLQVRNRQTGDLVQEITLPAAPGQNSLAVARESVYVTLMDGQVLCLR